MRWFHVIEPDSRLQPHTGIIVERSKPFGLWPAEICAIHLILAITWGKPRTFELDFGMRQITARPYRWLRLTYYTQNVINPVYRVNRIPFRQRITFDRGIDPDPRIDYSHAVPGPRATKHTTDTTTP